MTQTTQAPTTEYPAWQQTIRAAVAAHELVMAELAEKEAEKLAEKEAELGRNLGRVLSFFGIDVQPLANCVILDGFEFRLVKRAGSVGSSIDYRMGSTRDVSEDHIWFTLRIYKSLAGVDDELLEWFSGLYDDITVQAKRLADADWSYEQVVMATILDRITKDFEWQLENAKQRRIKPAAPPEPTPAEALLEALKAFISDELADKVVPLDY